MEPHMLVGDDFLVDLLSLQCEVKYLVRIVTITVVATFQVTVWGRLYHNC